MFDMGFLELLVILVIGLLVIGPERLPGAIKTTVIWVNGIRRNVSAARSEFEKQIGADEIRREIHNEEILASLRAAKQKQEEMRKQITSGQYTGVYKDEGTADTHTEHSQHNEDEQQDKPAAVEHSIHPEQNNSSPNSSNS